jgi:hypothetical protein
MDLKKGLPIRTVKALDKEGVECTFGVTTEMVNELILNCVLDAVEEPEKLSSEIKDFEDSFSYAVPQEFFQGTDKDLIWYINEYISDNYK